MASDSLLRHFSRDEFACPCCGANEMRPTFLTTLDLIRHFAGIPFVINSGYRCEKHNAEVGGSPTSSHLLGLAADIKTTNSADRFKIIQWAIKAGSINRIGIGKNFVHLDMDESPTKAKGVIWLYGS